MLFLDHQIALTFSFFVILYIHATLYSTYRLVVPLLEMIERIQSWWRFPFLKLSRSACWAKRIYKTAKRINICMQRPAVAPNWWNTGIQAAMYTDPFYRQWFVLLTHFSNLSEQNDCVHLPSKTTHPLIQPIFASNWCKQTCDNTFGNKSYQQVSIYTHLCVQFLKSVNKFFFVCWLQLDSSMALCNVEQFINPMCYLHQYFGPQWVSFQDIKLAFGLSSWNTYIGVIITI